MIILKPWGTPGRPIPFWTISGAFPHWFPSYEYYLVSAGRLWHESTNTIVRRSYPNASTRMFLDSGGFSFHIQNNDYPFSPDTYLNLVNHYKPLLWATMDYSCEDETLSNRTVSDAIAATLDKTSYLAKHATHPGFVPVIQGFTINQYTTCLELMARQGLTRPFMGVGSMCQHTRDRTLISLIAAVAAAAREIAGPNTKLHFFGIKISALRHPDIWPDVYSFDTGAWAIGRQGEPKSPNNSSEAQRRFWRYYDSLYDILNP